MYSSLAYEAQKAVLDDRLRRAAGWRALPRERGVRSSRGARRGAIAVALALVAWVLLSASQALAAGTTLYVSASASSDPVCGSASRSNPFATIAGALRCASNGTTIKIGTGTFAGGFTLDHNVVLQGSGAGTVISDPSAPLESLTEITIPDGHIVTLKSLTVDGAGREADVLAGGGSLTVINSSIVGGVAQYGAGIHLAPASGTTATLTVLRSTIANNIAFGHGGGIYVPDAPANAHNTLSLIDSTLTANQSDADGGAIKLGVLDALTVRDSTIAGNQANQYGGGLWVPGPGTGGTVSSPVTLTNTILAANTTNFGAPDCEDTQGITDGGHNLIGVLDASCSGISNGINGDQAGTAASPLDPKLGQLASNGGPTQTLALQLGSPAIGAGDPTDCKASPVNNTDQRNHTRNATTRLACDTGAYDTGGN
jgi:hypothetical protein